MRCWRPRERCPARRGGAGHVEGRRKRRVVGSCATQAPGRDAGVLRVVEAPPRFDNGSLVLQGLDGGGSGGGGSGLLVLENANRPRLTPFSFSPDHYHGRPV